MELTKSELKKIRENLPRGTNKVLADQFNLKVGTIRNILSGQSTNLAVLEAAVGIATQQKQAENNKVQAIKKVVNSL